MIAIMGVFLYVASLGLQLDPEVALVILGLASLIAVTQEGPGKFYVKSPLFIALVAFLGATALSILGSVNIYRSSIISLSLLPATLIFYLVADRFEIRHIRLFYILFSSLSLLISFILLLTAWNNPQENPSNWITIASLPHLLVPNDLLLLAIIAPFSLIVMQSNSGYILRALSVTSIVLSLGVIILFRSRGALLVLMATLIVTMILLWPKRLLISMVAFLVIGVLIDGLQGFLLINKFLGSWGSRIPLWVSAWYIFLDAPLLGYGPNAFALLSDIYLNKLQLPDWIPEISGHIPWVHNLYLEILAERGLLGALTFFCLLGKACVFLWRNKFSESGEVCAYSIGVLASFFGIALGGLFELSFVRHWFVVVLFALLAVTQVLSKNENRGRGFRNEPRTIN